MHAYKNKNITITKQGVLGRNLEANFPVAQISSPINPVLLMLYLGMSCL
jgi:hypothetical protein